MPTTPTTPTTPATPDLAHALQEITAKLSSLETDINSLTLTVGIDIVTVSEAVTCLRMAKVFVKDAINSVGK